MSKWEKIETPYAVINADSWFFKMNNGWQSNKHIVMSRTLKLGAEHPLDRVEHIAIMRKDLKPVSWAEKQKIKNELFGAETQAIEIFPKQSELIDDQNIYHLWLMPPDKELPLSLYL